MLQLYMEIIIIKTYTFISNFRMYHFALVKKKISNIQFSVTDTYDVKHGKSAFVPSAYNKGPDQTARMRNRIWALVVRLQIHCILRNI